MNLREQFGSEAGNKTDPYYIEWLEQKVITLELDVKIQRKLKEEAIELVELTAGLEGILNDLNN